jgi:RNA recognition motif-containing protein
MMTIYVGNLNFKTTEQEIKQLFSPFGEVDSVKLITDHGTGRSRGFGFIKMKREVAVSAINELDGKEFMGRNVTVHEAIDNRAKSTNYSSVQQNNIDSE